MALGFFTWIYTITPESSSPSLLNVHLRANILFTGSVLVLKNSLLFCSRRATNALSVLRKLAKHALNLTGLFYHQVMADLQPGESVIASSLK